MSVFINRHQAGLLCALGDGALVAPYYPGQYKRASGVMSNIGNNVAYASYPSTTPDPIVKLIRGPFSNSWFGYEVEVSTVAASYVYNGSVTAGFPPSPITGSPFYYTSYTVADGIFPRWTSETAWDLNAFPATSSFTAQGITAGGIFFPGTTYALGAGGASLSVSFDTGVLPNDASIGGDSTYDQEAQYEVYGSADAVCCWNDGAQIELNLVVYKIDFTATAWPSNVGYFDITTGSASYHTTLTHTVTIDSSWQGAFQYVVHTFTLPKVVGHFTFVNDFYVSAITAP